MSLPRRRLSSGALAFLYFVTHCALAHAAEANFWTERHKYASQRAEPARPAQRLARLPALSSGALFRGSPPPDAGSLPSYANPALKPILSALPHAYGVVRKIAAPARASTGKTVVLIQDVHHNADAQKNIACAVQELILEKRVAVVALEGTTGELDLSRLRAFPEREAIRAAADYLLRENKISGPIHTAMSGPGDIPRFVGVDDPEKYRANVEAYRRASRRIKEYQDKWGVRREKLERRKRGAYNPELLRLDGRVQAYREGRSGLGDYLPALAEYAEGDFPEIRTFLKALAMESALDFGRVERERARLIEGLSARLDKDGLTDLLERSVEHRMGRLRYGEFYRFLQDHCRRVGLSLSEYPAMDSYIRYVLLADVIQAEKLSAEIQEMEKAAYEAVIRRDEERRLIEESRRLHLLGKLIDFSLTPEEWEEYQRTAGPEEGAFDLSAFRAFHELALARDQSLAENLLEALRRDGSGSEPSAAVLVAGGFHARSVTERLRKAGVTVVVFTPKIEKVAAASGTAYLSVFAREKTPLEKLFRGDNLFLADNPLPHEIRAGVAPLLCISEVVYRDIAEQVLGQYQDQHGDADVRTLRPEQVPQLLFERLVDESDLPAGVSAFKFRENQVISTITRDGRTVTALVTLAKEAGPDGKPKVSIVAMETEPAHAGSTTPGEKEAEVSERSTKGGPRSKSIGGLWRRHVHTYRTSTRAGRVLYATIFSAAFFEIILLSYLAIHLQSILFSLQDTGFVIGFMYFSLMALATLAGILADKFSFKSMMQAGLGIRAAGFVLLVSAVLVPSDAFLPIIGATPAVIIMSVQWNLILLAAAVSAFGLILHTQARSAYLRYLEGGGNEPAQSLLFILLNLAWVAGGSFGLLIKLLFSVETTLMILGSGLGLVVLAVTMSKHLPRDDRGVQFGVDEVGWERLKNELKNGPGTPFAAMLVGGLRSRGVFIDDAAPRQVVEVLHSIVRAVRPEDLDPEKWRFYQWKLRRRVGERRWSAFSADRRRMFLNAFMIREQALSGIEKARKESKSEQFLLRLILFSLATGALLVVWQQLFTINLPLAAPGLFGGDFSAAFLGLIYGTVVIFGNAVITNLMDKRKAGAKWSPEIFPILSIFVLAFACLFLLASFLLPGKTVQITLWVISLILLPVSGMLSEPFRAPIVSSIAGGRGFGLIFGLHFLIAGLVVWAGKSMVGIAFDWSTTWGFLSLMAIGLTGVPLLLLVRKPVDVRRLLGKLRRFKLVFAGNRSSPGRPESAPRTQALEKEARGVAEENGAGGREKKWGVTRRMLLVELLNGIAFYSVMVSMAVTTESIVTSLTLVGILFAIRYGVLIMQLPVSSWARRWGYKRFLVAAQIVFAIGYLQFALGAYFQHILLLFIASALVGLGSALYTPPFRTYLDQGSRKEKRQTVNKFHLVINMGQTVGPLLGGLILLLPSTVAVPFSLLTAMVLSIVGLALLKGLPDLRITKTPRRVFDKRLWLLLLYSAAISGVSLIHQQMFFIAFPFEMDRLTKLAFLLALPSFMFGGILWWRQEKVTKFVDSHWSLGGTFAVGILFVILACVPFLVSPLSVILTGALIPPLIVVPIPVFLATGSLIEWLLLSVGVILLAVGVMLFFPSQFGIKHVARFSGSHRLLVGEFIVVIPFVGMFCALLLVSFLPPAVIQWLLMSAGVVMLAVGMMYFFPSQFSIQSALAKERRVDIGMYQGIKLSVTVTLVSLGKWFIGDVLEQTRDWAWPHLPWIWLMTAGLTSLVIACVLIFLKKIPPKEVSDSAVDALPHIPEAQGGAVLCLGWLADPHAGVDEAYFAQNRRGARFIVFLDPMGVAEEEREALLAKARRQAKWRGVSNRVEFRLGFPAGSIGKVNFVYSRLALSHRAPEEQSRLLLELYDGLAEDGKVFLVVRSDTGFIERVEDGGFFVVSSEESVESLDDDKDDPTETALTTLLLQKRGSKASPKSLGDQVGDVPAEIQAAGTGETGSGGRKKWSPAQLMPINELAAGIAAFTATAALAEIVESTVASLFLVGIIFAARPLSNLIQIPASLSAQRLGYKKFLLTANTITAIGYLCLGLGTSSSSGGLLFMALCLFGVGSAIYSPASIAYLNRFSNGQRDKVFSKFTIMANAGQALGFTFGVLMISYFGAREATILGAILGVLITVARFIAMKIGLPNYRELNPDSWREIRLAVVFWPLLLLSVVMFGVNLIYQQLFFITFPLETLHLTNMSFLAPIPSLVLGLLLWWKQERVREFFTARLRPGSVFAWGIVFTTLSCLALLFSGIASRGVQYALLSISVVFLAIGTMLYGPITMTIRARMAKERAVKVPLFVSIPISAAALLFIPGKGVIGEAFELAKNWPWPWLPWVELITAGLFALAVLATLVLLKKIPPAEVTDSAPVALPHIPKAGVVLSLGTASGGNAGVDEAYLAQNRPGVKMIVALDDAESEAAARKQAKWRGVTKRMEFRPEGLSKTLAGIGDGAADFLYSRLSLSAFAPAAQGLILNGMNRILADEGKAFVVVKSDPGFGERAKEAGFFVVSSEESSGLLEGDEKSQTETPLTTFVLQKRGSNASSKFPGERAEEIAVGRKKPNHVRSLLWVELLDSVAFYIVMASLAVTLESILTSLFLVGVLFAVRYGVLALQLPVSYLARRWGQKRFLLAAQGAWVLGYLLFALGAYSHHIPSLFLASALVGLGSSLYTPPFVTYLNQGSRLEKDRTYDQYHKAVNAAQIIGPLAGGLLLTLPGAWGITFAAPLASAALCVVCVVLLKDLPELRLPPPPRRAFGKGFWPLIPLFIIVGGVNLIHQQLFFITFPLAMKQMTSFAFLWVAPALVFGALLWWHQKRITEFVKTRWSLGRSLAMGVLLVLLSCVPFLLFSPSPPILRWLLLGIGVVSLAAGMMLFFPASFGLQSALAKERRIDIGLYQGMKILGAVLIVSLGKWYVGDAFELTSDWAWPWLPWIWLILAGVVALAIAVVLLILKKFPPAEVSPYALMAQPHIPKDGYFLVLSLEALERYSGADAAYLAKAGAFVITELDIRSAPKEEVPTLLLQAFRQPGLRGVDDRVTISPASRFTSFQTSSPNGRETYIDPFEADFVYSTHLVSFDLIPQELYRNLIQEQWLLKQDGKALVVLRSNPQNVELIEKAGFLIISSEDGVELLGKGDEMVEIPVTAFLLEKIGQRTRPKFIGEKAGGVLTEIQGMVDDLNQGGALDGERRAQAARIISVLLNHLPSSLGIDDPIFNDNPLLAADHYANSRLNGDERSAYEEALWARVEEARSDARPEVRSALMAGNAAVETQSHREPLEEALRDAPAPNGYIVNPAWPDKSIERLIIQAKASSRDSVFYTSDASGKMEQRLRRIGGNVRVEVVEGLLDEENGAPVVSLSRANTLMDENNLRLFIASGMKLSLAGLPSGSDQLRRVMDRVWIVNELLSVVSLVKAAGDHIKQWIEAYNRFLSSA